MLTARYSLCLRNRNNSYRESSISPLSTDSTFCGAGELTQDELRGSKEDFLPAIENRFANNCGSPTTTVALLNCNASNSRRRRIALDAAGDDNGGDAGGGKNLADSDPASIVYIRNPTDGKLYLLEFKAVEVKLIPIYLKHRTFEENVNDKCNQPYCHTTYVNHYNNRSSRFNQLKKSYGIDTANTTDRVSIMSSKKPMFPKPKCNDPKAKRVPRISDRESNLKHSVIYLRHEHMLFELKPQVMTLKSAEPINVENEKRRKQLFKELHMEMPVDLRNKAKIIVKHKGDVLKFLFTLSDINYSKVKVTTSVGVSAIDDSVYVKDFSAISNRKMYLSVPKTQYDYVNPMVNIHRENMAMKLNGVWPLWKEEQRRKRIRDYNRCRKKSAYDDIMELKTGSRICYEGFQCVNKAKAKTMSCLTDDDDYENWVISQQKRDLPPVESEELVKYESTFPGEVPDWDLVIYAK